MPAEPQQQTAGQGKAELTVESSLLDRIVSEGKLGQNEDERKQGKEWVGAFLEEVMRDQILVSKDTDAIIAARIAQLDEILSTQLNEIMHAPEFQKMEGSWRGLNYLVTQSETSTSLKIKVMNVTKRELLNDLKNCSEFDQSNMFKKVYE